MKVKSTEIRSGNYEESVNFSHPRLGIHSIQVGGKSFGPITAYGIYLIEDDKHEFTPLKLTEEWLIKLGFIKSNHTDYDYIDKQTARICLCERDGTYKLSVGRGELFGRQFEYVHQLQNLYLDLTGQELKYIHEDNL